MSGLASAALKPGKYRPCGISTGAVNQRSPRPATRMPKSVPLRHIAVTTVEPAMPLRRIEHALAHRHRHVEEELVVAGDELECLCQRGRFSSARKRGSQGPQKQRGASDVALVHLVAHGQAARDQRIERHAAGGAQRVAEQRAELVAQPGEARQHLGVVAAEAHHFAEALVEGAHRAVAERAVLDDSSGMLRVVMPVIGPTAP